MGEKIIEEKNAASPPRPFSLAIKEFMPAPMNQRMIQNTTVASDGPELYIRSYPILVFLNILNMGTLHNNRTITVNGAEIICSAIERIRQIAPSV